MKEIILTNKMVALVSIEDYDKVIQYKWGALKTKHTYYARRTDNWQYLHRFILNINDPNISIDHKDHNGLNNTRDNIRLANQSDNMKNRKKHRGASIYIGVSKHLYGRWLARININGKQKHIGLFDNEIDAAKAYNKAAIETGNIFYQLNDV